MQSLKKIHAWAQMQDPLCISMNINEHIRNKRNIVKIKGVYMQIYLHLSCLLSHTTSLGTNLMLMYSMLI